MGGLSPYDAFAAEFGEEGKAFLGRLGIVRIQADKVTLHPFLLGRKFQKAADRAALRMNGAAPAKRN